MVRPPHLFCANRLSESIPANIEAAVGTSAGRVGGKGRDYCSVVYGGVQRPVPESVSRRQSTVSHRLLGDPTAIAAHLFVAGLASSGTHMGIGIVEYREYDTGR